DAGPMLRRRNRLALPFSPGQACAESAQPGDRFRAHCSARVMISAPQPAFSSAELSQSECTFPGSHRAALARARAVLARDALKACTLCTHDCGVNRLAGELGVCRAGPHPRIFSAQIEVGDELELVPTFAIAFSGCDLRCDFCIT